MEALDDPFESSERVPVRRLAPEARTGPPRERERERDSRARTREFVGRPSPARPFSPIALSRTPLLALARSLFSLPPPFPKSQEVAGKCLPKRDGTSGSGIGAGAAFPRER